MSITANEQVINEFVCENREHLENIEPDLLALEKEGANVSHEIINRVFRAIHSIKGSSGFFGFKSLMDLSHIMENVLMKIRDGEMKPDSLIVDALFAGVDKVRLMLDDIHASNGIPFDEELNRLNAILENKTPETKKETKTETKKEEKTSTQQPENKSCDKDPLTLETTDDETYTVKVAGPGSLPNAVFNINADTLLTLFTSDLNLFVVWIDKAGDLKQKNRTSEEFQDNIATFGETFSYTQNKNEGMFHMLYGSILEPQHIAGALDIYESQILPVLNVCFNAKKAVVIEAESTREIPLHTSEKPSAFTPIASEPVKPTIENEQKSTHEPVCVLNEPTDEADEKGTFTAPAPARSTAAETIRVSVDLIDRLMNLAGELVLSRNQLRLELGETIFKNPKLGTIVQNIDTVTTELQEYIMLTRMQPMGNLLNKFPGLVRNLSRKLSKVVEFEVIGKEVELDKTILEGLSDPLTHLIRNAMDHGIELPEDREKKGKLRSGRLTVKVFHEGGLVNIKVMDDGKGIDPDVLVNKAVATGIINREKAKRLSDKEKLELIMVPGFSTAKDITDISGRGVGMDVVRTNIEELGGHIEIESVSGEGTCVHIRLPLTLAIIPSLIVGSAGLKFAIPQVNVQELVGIKAYSVAKRIETIGNAEVLRLREHLLPLVRLTKVLGLQGKFVHPKTGEVKEDRRQRLADRRQIQYQEAENIDEQEEKRIQHLDRRQSWHSDIYIVILRIGGNSFGLAVDELFDNEEIVVKPLSNHIKDTKCFAGATIMGDGRVAMILDAAGIANYSKLSFQETKAEEKRRKNEELKAKSGKEHQKHSILLFNYDKKEYFSLPLNAISRLEKIQPESIYKIGKLDFVDYQGDGIPLIYLDRFLPVSPFPNQTDEIYMIIPKANGQSPAGIVVSNILDTVDAEVTINKDATTPRGAMGTAFVNGKLTMFLSPHDLMDMFAEKCKAFAGSAAGKIR